ncbi:hypothetical protein V5799_023847 [Amblyomma americanum]|uniref:Uncharacterized protein n=1 Tax=Amblyomma americanum TaxID=6943 RepID=A0AAQ4FGC6_AMBAM
MSECLLACRPLLPVSIGQMKAIEGSRLKVNGLVGTPALITTGENEAISVRVANIALQDIRLRKNKVLGDLVDLEVDKPILNDNSKETGYSRHNLLRMFELSHIDEPQMIVILSLILENSSISSTSRTSIGLY